MRRETSIRLAALTGAIPLFCYISYVIFIIVYVNVHIKYFSVDAVLANEMAREMAQVVIDIVKLPIILLILVLVVVNKSFFLSNTVSVADLDRGAGWYRDMDAFAEWWPANRKSYRHFLWDEIVSRFDEDLKTYLTEKARGEG